MLSETYKSLVYRLLVEATVFIHFLWILFLVFGVLFALKKSRLAWVHFGGLLFSLVLNACGWYCPLTYLENHLCSSRPCGGNYGGSFIARHLEKMIYPDVSEAIIRIGGILFVCLNLLVYTIVVRRHFVNTRVRGSKVHGSRLETDED